METLVADCIVFHAFGAAIGAWVSRQPLTLRRCIWFALTGTYYWWYAVVMGARAMYKEIVIQPKGK